MESVKKSEITGSKLLGLGFIFLAGLILLFVGISLSNVFGVILGSLGVLTMLASTGLILLGTVRALRTIKKAYLFITVGVLIIASVVVYILYAKESCSQSAIRHSAYSKGGEMYSELTAASGEHVATLTRDNYIKLCTQDRFKLPF